jgi:hypothetical protein
MNSDIIVKYGDIKIEDGMFLTPLQTAKQPILTYVTTDTNTSTKYTLIMCDSKAVSPSGNHNHWLVINIPGNSLRKGDLNEGTTLLSYKGPAPPSGSGEHIYTFEIYKQNGQLDKTVMDENDRIISFNAIKNKIGIPDLTTPVISVFFYSKYTNPSGGSNIKRNRKRNKKTIKKNRKNRRSKKNRYIKR